VKFNTQKTEFNPQISTPGVKDGVNTVNNKKPTPSLPLQE